MLEIRFSLYGRKYCKSRHETLLKYFLVLSTESGAAVCEFFLKAACGKGKLYGMLKKAIILTEWRGENRFPSTVYSAVVS